MDIDAIKATAAQFTSFKPPADVQKIAEFAQLMQQAEPLTTMMPPDQLLSIQSEWMHATLAVDLTAKVAGVVGQNINKLVNMQ
ncbi:type III secretion system inner rod subunit SctI [Yersinia frederiksenii]|uniref:type III secretion system inner rod subunit SctI n=1 Tax=Yersinia frederiksenii TaxID=29484 RepID=UPI0011A87A6D|nr:type III secretion system inner rod subunit SctI [Yersinia frederiksenii]